MNILLISRCPPYPLHLGDRLIIWHLARELSQQGHRLTLLALTQYPEDTEQIKAYEGFFEGVELFSERPRTPMMYLRRLLGQHHPQRAEQAWQGDLWRAIEAQLARQHFDVIHLFGGVHVYEFAHLVQHLPTVITPYESYSLYLQRALTQKPQVMLWFNWQIAQQYERWMFATYQHVVVLTEQDQSALLQLNPALDVHVIPNGIALDEFTMPTAPRQPNTLLFVGNYDYPPNHDAGLLLAHDIFPQVRQQIPDAHLQLVGNAPPPDLQAYASDHITITGRVPRVQDYLASATVFVSPLRVGAGIKNKVLEAMAMGIPLVATPLSMEGIDAEDGRDVLVTPVEKMAEAIVALLRDERQQRTLATHARAIIEKHYSWQGVAQQYQALYQQARSS
ncbi:MAG: glycosyltransferase family 4 protein [Anaerolineae bacterium]